MGDRFEPDFAAFFEEHVNSDYDTVAISLKPLFYYSALFIFIEAFVIVLLTNTKSSVVITQMIMTCWVLFLIAKTGLISRDMLTKKINGIIAYYKKGVKLTAYILLTCCILYLTIKATLIFPREPSKEIMEQFVVQEISWLINQIPIEVPSIILFALITPILLLLFQFFLGRFIVWVFKRIAVKTLENSKSNPLNIITWLIAFAFAINFTLSVSL